MVLQPEHVPTEWVGVSSRGRIYEVVSIVFIMVAFISVVLRLIARLTTIRKLLVDDYICIVAQIFAFGLMTVAIIFTETAAMGWHITEVPPAQAERFFKIFFAAEIIYGILAWLYKLAVIFLYRNIFGDIKAFNIASWVLVAVCTGWWLGGLFSTVFQCMPIMRIWNPTLPGHCINQEAYILGNGIVNLALDVLILVYPLPMIWRLNLSLRKKIALSAMFLIGSVVCIASILRIITSFPLDFSDSTYTLFHVAIWSEIEPSVGIIAACLPTLRQFLFRRLPGRSTSADNRQYNSKAMTPLDSTVRSHTAVALTGWKSNEAYTEVGSPVATPKSSAAIDLEENSFSAANFPASFLDIDPAGNPQDEADNRSIFVKKEVVVTTE